MITTLYQLFCERSGMTIGGSNFTPWMALAGGVLIGAAAGLFVVLNGRIAGISGLLASLLERGAEGRGESAVSSRHPVGTTVLVADGRVARCGIPDQWLGLLAAGLLVGIGTRYGSGCTSGHGVCGISRLSPRSVVATLAFMAAGFATVFVLRHLLGG